MFTAVQDEFYHPILIHASFDSNGNLVKIYQCECKDNMPIEMRRRWEDMKRNAVDVEFEEILV